MLKHSNYSLTGKGFVIKFLIVKSYTEAKYKFFFLVHFFISYFAVIGY